MAKLNARQWKFAQLYASGPDDVRGNATACYMKVWTSKPYESARRDASRLLSNADIVSMVHELHEEAKKQAIAQMRDWKEMAPAAQEYIDNLAKDDESVRILTPTFSAKGQHLADVRDVPAMRLQLEANKFLLEQAYPRAAREIWENKRKALEEVLGVGLGEELPPSVED